MKRLIYLLLFLCLVSSPSWAIPPSPPAVVGAGTGDVLGPATNSADYVPQWDGANSKTLKNGIAVTANGKSLIEAANYAAMAVLLGLGSGDVTDVWDCASGNCQALTAGASDTLDASLAASSNPFKTGNTAGLPGTCTAGFTYHDTQAKILYLCTSANTWSQVFGVGADGSFKLLIPNNTAIAPTGSSNEIYPEVNIWKVNQNGTESSIAIGPTGGQVSFAGPTQARVVTLPDAAVTIPATPIGGTLGATTNVICKSNGIGGVTAAASGITEDGTVVQLTALNLATTGTISGGSLTPVIDDPDNFAANFTGVNLYGGTFICNAAGTVALPTAAVNMNFTIVLEGANAVILNPDSGGTADTIYMNGLAAAQDENITSSTSGAMCIFQYRAANSWMATCNGFVEATPP
jgi:hypothetical protein